MFGSLLQRVTSRPARWSGRPGTGGSLIDAPRGSRGMKPGRPRVVSCSRNSLSLGWDPWGKAEDAWYLLEKKDRVLGWQRAYMGFKTQTEVGPLAPGDFYEFRLRVMDRGQRSDYSDVLLAATKDDLIPVTQLHRAVENGPVTSLRKTLSQRPSAVDVANRRGQTPLRLAVLKNNTAFMGILLNHGADVCDAEAGSGRTPLMVAAHLGHVEAVQLLLEKGSSWQTRDRNGLTALNYAVDNSRLSVLELAVAEGADLGTKDGNGWSLLMRGVVLRSSLEVLRLLLENGSDPNEADDRGQTVLMQAVLSGRPPVVRLLLRKGADATARNVYGHSARDMATHSTLEEMQKTAALLGSEDEAPESLREGRPARKSAEGVVEQGRRGKRK